MRLIYLLLLIFLCACRTTGMIADRTVLDENYCNSITSYYYGEKGESPVNNDVWKCYDWEIQERQ